MSESTPQNTDVASRINLSSEPLPLSPEHFHLDEQNRLVIDRNDLARIIQNQLSGVGEATLKPNVEVTVSVGVSF
jgi:hypothetical protein